jgi:hypothetical protein
VETGSARWCRRSLDGGADDVGRRRSLWSRDLRVGEDCGGEGAEPCTTRMWMLTLLS